MGVKVVGTTKFYNGEKFVGESNYNSNASANPHMEITEEDITMSYKAAGDEIVAAWRDFNSYIKRHHEVWEALANKLWDGFVDYKDVPFGDEEIWHE